MGYETVAVTSSSAALGRCRPPSMLPMCSFTRLPGPWCRTCTPLSLPGTPEPPHAIGAFSCATATRGPTGSLPWRPAGRLAGSERLNIVV
ncbi:hypothetical protein K505DRAFT_330780 [Melanomma pulvis-pyrius CBS 109.77]|uniref:Uncharacterized protein n=1 Tax=Melanomma pulvis-pyrius CBS 109.77 TaxID=1314802 RepID=A0A6A6WPA3_9PLEO|nr:hypothetical protein K505DRAFT_330780 [Melanomma pulvis-pyrius CBS 109.77]